MKATWTHGNSQISICDFINKNQIETAQIIAVNNDENGNWWLMYDESESHPPTERQNVEEAESLSEKIKVQEADLSAMYQQLYETRISLRKMINAFTKWDDKEKHQKAIEQANYILNKYFNPADVLRQSTQTKEE